MKNVNDFAGTPVLTSQDLGRTVNAVKSFIQTIIAKSMGRLSYGFVLVRK